MANIKIELDYTLTDGMNITFKTPCDCSNVTGLIIYYPGGNGITTSKIFKFKDAHRNDLSNINDLFIANIYINIIVNITNGEVYIQNADTNAYLEGKLKDLESHLTRGPFIITESQLFDLSKLGIEVGDSINVICIGGGAGGITSATNGGDGGDAGKNGESNGYGSGGRAGTGYGAGGGGGAGYGNVGGGGGGSGYVSKATITVSSLSIPITIGAGGKGGYRASTDPATNGGSTSFGTYLTAEGGKVGDSNTNGGEGGNKGVSGTTSNGGRGGNGYTNTGTFIVDSSNSYPTISGNGCVMIWW